MPVKELFMIIIAVRCGYLKWFERIQNNRASAITLEFK